MIGVIKIGRIYLNVFLSILLFPLIFLFAFIGGSGELIDFVIKTAFFVVLLMIAETDYYSFQIPNYLIILLSVIVVLDIILGGRMVMPGSRITGIFPSAFLLILALYKPGTIGGGDIKLVAVAGVYLGFYGILYAAMTASILAGCVAVVGMLTKKWNKHTKLAMAPYYTVGIIFFLMGQA